MKEIMQSRKFKIAALGTGALVLALLIFAAGVAVGFKKARFSYSFGENYERNFMGSRMGRGGFGPGGMMGFARGFEGRDFRNAHGLAGEIISISDNNIVMKDRDNKENTVQVSDKTVINRFRDTIKLSDLKNGDQIVVMGRPGDNGVINAELIRVFDNLQTK